MKKLLSLVLAILMIFTALPFASYAKAAHSLDMNSENSLIRPVVYRKICLEEYAQMFSEDPDVTNLNLQGNALSFTMLGDINVEILDISTSKDITALQITEGKGTQELIIDHRQNTATVDGKDVTICKTEASTFVLQEDPSSPRGTTWIQMGNTTYSDIYAEVQIRNIYITTLISLITAGASLAVSITVTVANAIISAYIASQSTSRHTYVARSLYYDEALPWDHYLQKTVHYKYSNYTGYITTCNREYAGY